MRSRFLCFIFSLPLVLFASEEELAESNCKISALREELFLAHQEISKLALPSEKECLEAKDRLRALSKKIGQEEERWRALAKKEGQDEESYGLWDHQETTLGALIMEYGSQDFLYLMPPEVSSIKIQAHSQLPIPRASWNEMLELILAHNGVGFKPLNPYTRELYLYKQEMTGASAITLTLDQLEVTSDGARVMHILTPAPENLRQVHFFFDRFRDVKKTFVHQVGQKVVLVGPKEDLRKLVALHESIWDKPSERTVCVVALSKISSEDATRLLSSFFGGLGDAAKSPLSKSGHDLAALPLAGESSIILIGPSPSVDRAKSLIQMTEAQIRDPLEVTIETYQCRHSDPIDLSEILEKVYGSIAQRPQKGQAQGAPAGEAKKGEEIEIEIKEENTTNPYNIFDGYNSFEMPRVVTPPVVSLGKLSSQQKQSTSRHFIPYPKTGSILMVVRRETLPRLKELLRRLDVPKKMVQMEVLLCEKKVRNKRNAGLNILKIGSTASQTHQGGLSYDGSLLSGLPGLFQFLFSREKSNAFPAFDLSYHFLLTHEDIKINANPSVLTINQTPATISVVEEISINNGAAPIDSNKGVVFEKSYARAQFGITLVLTPTIHEPDEQDLSAEPMVSLETNITFDTINSDREDRPDVNRRHIQNQVRIPSGQTVVLGGLLRKHCDQRSEKIPFFGEIPGFGKLFGTFRTHEHDSEMFIFITPKVINDPICDLERLRCEQLSRRPGDCPEFLLRQNEARCKGRGKLFEESIKMIQGSCDS